MMTITEIMKLLPHRYPMLLVDRILEIEDGKRIVGLKNVTANEQFFQGHFPGTPLMPLPLIVTRPRRPAVSRVTTKPFLSSAGEYPSAVRPSALSASVRAS